MLKDGQAHDYYCMKAPNSQNALDIFKGEWSSKFPGDYASLRAGEALLFEDPRLQWGLDSLGGVEGQKVLELGPLEGGHSYMLEQQGASKITAIEANARAFLKCLIVKEILGLRRVDFLCGDFMEYLKADPPWYDLCIASGVLYHMQDPAQLLYLISAVTPKLILWTHYFDKQIIQKNQAVRSKFKGDEQLERGGYAYTGHKYHYGAVRINSAFCGGSGNYSYWMERDAIFAALQTYGFTSIKVGFEQPHHPNGPAFILAAEKV